MRLDEVHRLITESTEADWHSIPGYISAFRYDWAKSAGPDGWELYYASHHTLLVNRSQVALTIGYGMPEDTTEDRRSRVSPAWNTFTDSSPLVTQFADIFWNGALVDRYLTVPVDGARATLPWPHPVLRDDDSGEFDYQVTRFQVALAQLIDETSGIRSQFDRYLHDAGFKVVD